MQATMRDQGKTFVGVRSRLYEKAFRLSSAVVQNKSVHREHRTVDRRERRNLVTTTDPGKAPNRGQRGRKKRVETEGDRGPLIDLRGPFATRAYGEPFTDMHDRQQVSVDPSKLRRAPRRTRFVRGKRRFTFRNRAHTARIKPRILSVPCQVTPGRTARFVVLITLGLPIVRRFAIRIEGLRRAGALAQARDEHPDFVFAQMQSRSWPSRMAASIRRLPVSQFHERHRVQPDRHFSVQPFGEAHDDVPICRFACDGTPVNALMWFGNVTVGNDATMPWRSPVPRATSAAIEGTSHVSTASATRLVLAPSRSIATTCWADSPLRI